MVRDYFSYALLMVAIVLLMRILQLDKDDVSARYASYTRNERILRRFFGDTLADKYARSISRTKAREEEARRRGVSLMQVLEDEHRSSHG
jgi:hypothetical protein